MPNPWLAIPLGDYEGHMSSAEVQQLPALSELFGFALEHCEPASVAILGIAGGNGLDQVDRNVIKRVVGFDINPNYLDEVRRRFDGIDLHCIDLAAQRVETEPVELVHAALVFEHAGADLCLENAVSMVAAGGALSVVLQQPSKSSQAVGASSFTSLQKLKDHFAMLDPKWLEDTLASRGFELTRHMEYSLHAGKTFWMGIFQRKIL